MSAITDLIGGIVSGLGDTAVKIRTALTGVDPAKQAEITQLTLNLEAQAKAAEINLIKAQADINLEEAKSPNGFRANWRPAVGWTCAAGLALMMIVRPIAQWVLVVSGSTLVLPTIDTESLMGLLVPLLGLGAYRTYEKVNGASR